MKSGPLTAYELEKERENRQDYGTVWRSDNQDRLILLRLLKRKNPLDGGRGDDQFFKESVSNSRCEVTLVD